MDRVGIMTERVGTNVRRLRREQDMSIRVLTEKVGPLGWSISVQGLSRLETGQRGITVDQMAILAEALNVSMVELLEEPLPETEGVLTGGGEVTAVGSAGLTDSASVTLSEAVTEPVNTMLDRLAMELRHGSERIAAASRTRPTSSVERLVSSLSRLADQAEAAKVR